MNPLQAHDHMCSFLHVLISVGRDPYSKSMKREYLMYADQSVEVTMREFGHIGFLELSRN